MAETPPQTLVETIRALAEVFPGGSVTENDQGMEEFISNLRLIVDPVSRSPALPPSLRYSSADPRSKRRRTDQIPPLSLRSCKPPSANRSNHSTVRPSRTGKSYSAQSPRFCVIFIGRS